MSSRWVSSRYRGYRKRCLGCYRIVFTENRKTNEDTVSISMVRFLKPTDIIYRAYHVLEFSGSMPDGLAIAASMSRR